MDRNAIAVWPFTFCSLVMGPLLFGAAAAGSGWLGLLVGAGVLGWLVCPAAAVLLPSCLLVGKKFVRNLLLRFFDDLLLCWLLWFVLCCCAVIGL